VTPESQRAFRWRDTLESGGYATIREMVAAEQIKETYVGGVLADAAGD
jgi:hypothetical protein